jgi:hypothetical protein
MTVRPSIGLRPLYLALQDAPGTYTSTLRMASRIYCSLPVRRELEAFFHPVHPLLCDLADVPTLPPHYRRFLIGSATPRF